MKINHGEIDCNPDNTYILQYPNDMLNGVIIDLDDNYAFIPQVDDGVNYNGFQAQLAAEGIETVVLGEDVDMTEPPHCWVLQSMIKCVVKSAEALLDQTE